MADQLGFTSDDAIAAISETQLLNFFFFATLSNHAADSVAVYDTMLTFSKEVRCIWQRKFGIGTVLYLLIRYTPIITIVFEYLNGSSSLKTVTSFALFYMPHQWIPTIVVFALTMFDPAINIQAAGLTPTLKYIYMGEITRAISIAGDAAVLGFTLWRTIYIFREDAEVRANNRLTTALLYNGSVQFSLMLLFNILSMILDIVNVASDGATIPHATFFIYIQNTLISIILSRFILSLRCIYHTTNNPAESSSKYSSVHFASAIEGNMGATLSDSWAEGREESDQGLEEIQYSEYPFSTGLSDIKENSSSHATATILTPV
ncbi:hypothetical protein QCA50_008190 [Cerrena zonata]|uniref:DUF6533 domain-containing protein n=1 Tax=Cerrena zonata TaxID=2478898 RepID=A0AAW0GAQ8_9APHY